MLAPAQASHKHKIRTETVVPQLQRTAVVALDDTRRGRYIQRLGCAFVSQCDGVKQLDLAALEQTRDLVTCLGCMGRARDVGEDATGARQGDCPVEQLTLEDR